MSKLADIKALDRSELQELTTSLGQPRYRADQLYRWVHGSDVTSFEEMGNLPADFRSRLAENAQIHTAKEVTSATSSDGTIKFLFQLPSGRHFETVLIPDMNADGTARRVTVCVSSQVGCAMACSFCATGTMGFLENLSAGLIVDQVRHVDRVANETYGRGVSNVVFMGMGEPMLNYKQVTLAARILVDQKMMSISRNKITISTVGLARQIKKMADDDIPANLAVSLHAPVDEKRSSIMPVNRSERTDLTALKKAIQHYASTTGKMVMYEYCMFEGFNDSVEDAVALSKVVAWAPSKVNLIMYNPVPGKPFQPTDESQLDRFIEKLVDAGVTVTVRRSRGQDIDAACGQLAVSA